MAIESAQKLPPIVFDEEPDDSLPAGPGLANRAWGQAALGNATGDHPHARAWGPGVLATRAMNVSRPSIAPANSTLPSDFPTGTFVGAVSDNYRRRDTLGQVDFREETRVNKHGFVAHVAARSSLSKSDADASVSAVFSNIVDTLASGETVTNAGFGIFSTRSRAARPGRNPRTGESIAIATSTAPSFKAGKTLRNAVK